MGLICAYFAAPSEEDAGAVVHCVGGPSDSSGQLLPDPTKRSLFRRRPAATGTSSGSGPGIAFPTVDGGGIEPVVQMGTLRSTYHRTPV